MVSNIKRALTPTVGQNSIQKWLDSPELANPIENQSTELQLVQEITQFQVKRRFQSLTVGLAGADTTAFFNAVVPETEMWFIELLSIAHDSAASPRVFEMRISKAGILPLPITVARVAVPAGAVLDQQSVLLVGGALNPLAADDKFNQPDGIEVGPGSIITVDNISGMIAGEFVNFRIRYRLRPLPLEERRASIWTGIAGV